MLKLSLDNDAFEMVPDEVTEESYIDIIATKPLEGTDKELTVKLQAFRMILSAFFSSQLSTPQQVNNKKCKYV